MVILAQFRSYDMITIFVIIINYSEICHWFTEKYPQYSVTFAGLKKWIILDRLFCL